MALYNEYRPVTLKEVIGQEHITKTLMNAYKNNSIPHALLFVGVRGTGKTTIARIVSRLVNCENPMNGNPCNKCNSCKDILNGQSADIIEMDAASNRGVEDVEDLRERVKFPPMVSTKKVYIIDEAHQLTNMAKDALLKTLENPPEHAMFILATTEERKIPFTIRSRCQLHVFRKASIESIVENLKRILNDKNVSYEEEALKYIAKGATGSFRDSITILESVINLSGKVTYEDAQYILGLPAIKDVQEVVKTICAGDSVKALAVVEKLKCSTILLNKLIDEITTTFFEIAKKVVLDGKTVVLGHTVDNLIKLGTYISRKKDMFSCTEDWLALELIVIEATQYSAKLLSGGNCE